MIKDILIFSNLSLWNQSLIEYTTNFCKYYDCKLHVVHFREMAQSVLANISNYANVLHADSDTVIKEKVRSKLSQCIQKLGAENVEIHVFNNTKAVDLMYCIGELKVNFIFIGNEELSEDSGVFEHKKLLLDMLDTPVIAIPKYQLFDPFNKVNFLTTHTENDLSHLELFSNYFSKAIIDLVHLDSASKINTPVEKKWINYVQNKIGDNLNYQLVKQELPSYLDKAGKVAVAKYDAFVFTAKKRNFWRRMIDPSTTLGLICNINIPSVIFKVDQGKEVDS